jgi:formate dehydrogenase assembly factor FdhD
LTPTDEEHLVRGYLCSEGNEMVMLTMWESLRVFEGIAKS